MVTSFTADSVRTRFFSLTPRFPHWGVGPALGVGAPIHNEKGGAGFFLIRAPFSLYLSAEQPAYRYVLRQRFTILTRLDIAQRRLRLFYEKLPPGEEPR